MLLKFRLVIISVVAVLSLYGLTQHWRTIRTTVSQAKTSWPQLHKFLARPVINEKAQFRFWKAFEFILSNNGPGIGKPNQNGRADWMFYDANQEREFPEILEMSDEDINKMKSAHQNFLKGVRVQKLDLVYNPGTKGIVTTGGGVFLPIVVTNLRILRKLGSTLPMEVFLADGMEYESYICEEILPPLDGRCVILSEVLNTAPHDTSIKRYQLKMFSILFSSFEEVVFLDADSIPMYDPRILLESEPYKSHGMVIWPDFWYNTRSIVFTNITGFERPPSTFRATTESGQMLLDKKTHKNTILLASYYNFYGPDHYYPILSQGGAGEGDKETFLAAAQVAGERVYQVFEKVVAMGHDMGGWLLGSAMVQFDPSDDYRLTENGTFRVKGDNARAPRPFFVHAHQPKLNPGRIYDDYGQFHMDNGTLRRLWTDPKELLAEFNHDPEKLYFREAMWVACNLEDRFRDWSGLQDICLKAVQHWKAFFEPDFDEGIVLGADWE